MKKLSTTLGNLLIKSAAVEGDGVLENSELVIWDEEKSLSLHGKEIVDLYYLLKKGLERGIIRTTG